MVQLLQLTSVDNQIHLENETQTADHLPEVICQPIVYDLINSIIELDCLEYANEETPLLSGNT